MTLLIRAALPMVAVLAALHPVAAEATLIRGAQVFDGRQLLGVRDVLFEDGLIVAVQAAIEPPAGCTIIEADGATLLPGLIDAHTHTIDRDNLRSQFSFPIISLPRFEASPTAAVAPGPPRSGRGCGCESTRGNGGGASWFVVLVALAMGRRRARRRPVQQA